MPNPSTIKRRAKIFKETGSVKNRKVNRQRHILKEETLDEDWREIRTYPPEISINVYHRKLEYLCRLYKEQQHY